jgi:hypothetical protein
MKGPDQVFAVINTSIHCPTGLISVRNIRDMSYRFGVNALSTIKSLNFIEILHYA